MTFVCPHCGTKLEPIGPTGDKPQGSIHPDDEGELRIAVGTQRDHRVVVLEFGTQLAWLALPAAEARQLGETLLERAAELAALPVC